MIFFAIGFLIGAVLSSWQILSITLAVFCCIIAIAILWRYRGKMISLIVAGALAGVGYSALVMHKTISWEPDKSIENKAVVIRGLISSLPVINEFGTHFLFKLIPQNAYVRLSVNDDEREFKPGDKYEFTAKLKRIHGLHNPGSFDYESWALQNDIRASGSVVMKQNYHYLGHDFFSTVLLQIRYALQQRIQMNLPDSRTSHWLPALMIGERSNAPAEHWQVLRATGTNHLMAIAGLHIGLIAGLIYACVRLCWSRSVRLLNLYPAPLAASFGSLAAAWIYSALAGFSIPTQRACIMVTFILGARLLRRNIPAWHAWSGALICVLFLNPLSVLSESFWLSFATLALIIYGMQGRYAPHGLWWKWGRVQAVISIGLLPISILFFQQTSLVGVIANSIAIPWLGFLILPFCLASDIFLFLYPPLGSLLLWLADKSLLLLWNVLEWFANMRAAAWTISMPSPIIFIITLLACLLLLLPRGMPLRVLGFVWLLPLILFQHEKPENHHFNVTVLDVGQGLSIVVQTTSHTLVYDAGSHFGDMDMGESVVLPYLRTLGITTIDKLIISHGDNDHIGGAYALIKNLPVKSILTSAPDKFTPPASLCTAGTSWQWDGVNFSLLYPFTESLALGNDSSCVLKIESGIQSILLTGDIEKFAENQLLQFSSAKLAANVLIAPHHGSKTSSQLNFIRAVNPLYVVYSRGYLNRYRLPHPAIVKRYEDEKIISLDTVESGAIKFEFKNNQETITPSPYMIHANISRAQRGP